MYRGADTGLRTCCGFIFSLFYDCRTKDLCSACCQHSGLFDGISFWPHCLVSCTCVFVKHLHTEQYCLASPLPLHEYFWTRAYTVSTNQSSSPTRVRSVWGRGGAKTRVEPPCTSERTSVCERPLSKCSAAFPLRPQSRPHSCLQQEASFLFTAASHTHTHTLFPSCAMRRGLKWQNTYTFPHGVKIPPQNKLEKNRCFL